MSNDALTTQLLEWIGNKPRNYSDAQVYAGKGWQGYGDWLGTGRRARSRPSDRPTNSSRLAARCVAIKQELL